MCPDSNDAHYEAPTAPRHLKSSDAPSPSHYASMLVAPVVPRPRMNRFTPALQDLSDVVPDHAPWPPPPPPPEPRAPAPPPPPLSRAPHHVLGRWIAAWLHAAGFTRTMIVVSVGSVLGLLALAVSPARLAGPAATNQLARDSKDIDASEQLAMLEKGTFVDPAPMFRRLAERSGVPAAQVLASFADASHWMLKVRYDKANTVCVQLVTMTDRRVPRPSCHEMSAAERNAPVAAETPAR